MADNKKRMTRKAAIRRRNAFIAMLALIVTAVIVILIFVFTSATSDETGGTDTLSSTSSVSSEESKSESVQQHTSSIEDVTESSSSDNSSSEESSSHTSSVSSHISSVSSQSKPKKELDPDFADLLLVNGKNPLPADYDYEGNLTIIEDKYLCGHRNRMNADVYPYATAMVEAAWADGVELYILSPYRSYGDQQVLFENEVKKWMNTGMKRAAAENKASTVVARPGTSEHHTGMAIDFNSVEDSFEYTDEYEWLSKNAQNYGFILRYTKEKQPKTGVIHESWHWRFVGINKAKEIKASGLCLEEFLEQTG